MVKGLKQLGKMLARAAGIALLLTVGAVTYLGQKGETIDPPLVVGATVFFLCLGLAMQLSS